MNRRGDELLPAGDGATFAEARAFIAERKQRGVVLGLGRMRGFAEALGNPHLRVPCVHIAGTNGKGSVAAMLEAVLRAAGWRTGLYTSPHLIRLGERVQVDRRSLTDAEIAMYIEELRPIVRRLEQAGGAAAGPSYFEFMTGLSFLHFERSRCDIAVIEVGMGGRLDATNIVNPELSVITSVGLDHTEVLGDTVEAIAAEKAGIVKPGRPLVLGRVPAAAESVIRRVAAEQRAGVSSVREIFGEEISRYPNTNLAGGYQRWNAATATVAARLLGSRWRVAEPGIAQALRNVDWPARWERRLAGDRTVIVDSTHNAEGASVLDENLGRLLAETGRRPLVVVGVLGAVRAAPLLAVASRHAAAITLVQPKQRRACTFEELRALVPADFSGSAEAGDLADLFPAASQCALGGPGDVIVVTGSIYLAGEVLARLLTGNGRSESDLQDF